MTPVRRRLVAAGLSSLLALCVLNPGRNAMPPIDRDEPRYAQATAQMLETGDFIDVRYQDQPRYLQPAGIYWLQAAAVTAFGAPGVRDIGVNRLVSLAGATAALFMTAEIGAMAFGEAVGFAAMALLASTVLLGFEARLATIDAALLAAVLVAQAALLRMYLAPAARSRAWFAFWAALGVGVMLKGPVILLVSFGTLALLAAVERRAAWWRALRPGWGVPVFLAVAAPWLVAIGIKTDGAFFHASVGNNFLGKVATGQQAHFGLPGFHLALLPLMAGAAFPFIVRATPAVWARRRQRVTLFLLCWIAPTWVVFELIATKLPHYVLPTYPALAVLAAGHALDPVRAVRWTRWVYRPLCAVWLLVLAVVALGPLGALLWTEAPPATEVAAKAALGLTALGAAALSVRLIPGRASVACAVVAAAALSLGAYTTLPQLRTMWIAPRVAALVRDTRPCPDSVVAATSFSDPSLVYLLGTRTRLTDATDAADFVADEPQCRLALVGSRALPAFLQTLTARGVTALDLGHVEGITLSTGRRLDLGLYAAGP